jgi:cytosine deaminase
VAVVRSTRELLRGVRLPDDSSVLDIEVVDGLVSDVRTTASRIQAEHSSADGFPESEPEMGIEQFDGMLLLPALQEHHAHLDKALTADKVQNPSGDLMGAIEGWIEAESAGVFDVDEMQQRAEAAIEQLIHAGTSRIRTHVNVGASDPDLRNLRAVHAARQTFANFVDIEIVALMHSPLAGSRGAANRVALDKAIEFGIDLIGGCPHLEADGASMIEHVLATARHAGLGLDLHVDETVDPDMLTIESLCRSILEQGFDLPVTASHCVSLAMQSLETQVRLASMIAAANVRVVALPQTNLFLQGRATPQAMPRAIAPLKVLADHGVRIAAGGDNAQDPFNPMGRNDPLEAASLLVVASHLDPRDALQAVSSDTLLRGSKRSDLIGRPADFLAIDALNVRQALANAPATRATIRRGQVIARTTVSTQIRSPQESR